ncbi:MAG: hypothetical protein A2381_07125 [Bdellovibrionales bacterium RIFOXYB1_FULL_37_110]|nr:MAG: hypothetical protein A2417_15000 [Bdellovibrionales bacterium RIFOXYC1_FULL_37_79]OFZ57834.1 MAG: hypothetical protein A2381_07125 [Bdellovibrionales bacterium RIFOXYB1_FULL_37_110]OFZ62800.1 MAG: hypothetical protein A2577_16645 [Bdellovibrionales bacterium RIFOXYD1_FULL_36_51]
MKILINLIVIIFFFTFQISYQSPLKIHPNTSEAFEKGDWVALALISSVALGIYAFGFSDSKKKDNASSSSNNSDNDSDPSSNTSGGNWFEVINATGGQTKTLKGLDYNRDWIFEVEMKSINVGYRQRLIKEGDGYLDVWFEGSNSLAWRLYNKKIWFMEAFAGIIEHNPYPAEDDHWSQVTGGNFKSGDHILRIEYKISKNETKFYWDNKMVGHYKIFRKSSFAPMKSIQILNMSSAIVRYKYE